MSNPQVELHITGHGVITLELDAVKAPKTVANFLNYVNKGHYANTVFHRVIPGFMIQGGGFEVGMKQKPTDAEIENEATNGLKNDNYTVAMARTNAPHSASSQFFINVANNGFLNHTAPSASGWGYEPLGKSMPPAHQARTSSLWKNALPRVRSPGTTGYLWVTALDRRPTLAC